MFATTDNDPKGINQQWVERDLKHIWHPCTQMKDFERLPLTPIKKGDGVWLEDFEGNRYMDCISSWWVNIFGHANPQINQALKDQLDNLEHTILANFTHSPIIELTERLVAITPEPLQRAFFADNGSAAVEVALKMSFHYWRNTGQPKKTKFVALANSYHGETLGALGVSDVGLYKEAYEPLLLEPIIVPGGDCYNREEGESWEDCSRRQFEAMEQLLAERHDEISAVIVEPLVQCSGSMRMYHPVYLILLRDACDRYNVHLIADEIAVGFGRTGTMFGCEQAGISPDFMCMSKGLTGGYMPLSVTLTTEQVYQAFYDDYEKMNAFLHSHSYTGNTLGCAAALATLKIFEEQPILEQNRGKAARILSACEPLQEHPNIAEVRQTGMITAIEMVQDKQTREPYPWQQRRGLKVYQHALSKGVFLRPLGNIVYFMPPYVINNDEIDLMVNTAIEGIQLATADA